jgi:hypothetical protein
MTFATVIAENGGNQSTDATDHTVNLPDGSNVAGRRILLFFTSDGSSETFTYPADWVEILAEGGSGFTSAIIYKNTLGTEGYPATGATITITVSSVEQSAHTSYLLSGFHTDAPAVSTGATGTGVSGDPDALNPAGWDVEDTLWFAYVSFNGVNSTTPRITVYPTSYTNTRSDLANGSGGHGVTTGVGRRENATASEDPSTFTSDTSVTWRAVTVGVRPAPLKSKSMAIRQAVNRASTY